MFQSSFQLTIVAFLSLILLFPTSLKADTILAGTNLSGTSPGPELCPVASGCQNRFGQFATPDDFDIHDIKIVLSGPAISGSNTNGNFEVFLNTDLGSASNVRTPIGTGHLTFSASDSDGSVVQVFDFSALNIPMPLDSTLYLEVDGENLNWNTASPLPVSLGVLGFQYSCDPSSGQCAKDLASYDRFPGNYALQVSGTDIPPQAVTPEPSSLLLVATGLFSASIITVRARRVAHT
jgi:hypothetical protein